MKQDILQDISMMDNIMKREFSKRDLAHASGRLLSHINHNHVMRILREAGHPVEIIYPQTWADYRSKKLFK